MQVFKQIRESKFESKFEPGLFMEYSQHNHVLKIYNLDTRNIVERKDIKFDKLKTSSDIFATIPKLSNNWIKPYLSFIPTLIQKKFTTFALRLTEVNTNPVKYFI